MIHLCCGNLLQFIEILILHKSGYYAKKLMHFIFDFKAVKYCMFVLVCAAPFK